MLTTFPQSNCELKFLETLCHDPLYALIGLVCLEIPSSHIVLCLMFRDGSPITNI